MKTVRELNPQGAKEPARRIVFPEGATVEIRIVGALRRYFNSIEEDEPAWICAHCGLVHGAKITPCQSGKSP